MDIYDKYIRTINDFPIEGIKFRDITPLLSNGDSFHQAIMDLNKELPSYEKWDKIICAESRGFLFGSPLAALNSKGIVIARKPHKLPLVGLKESYALEYGEATIEIPLGSINKGDRVIILDDLIATGGSAAAMKRLVERSGGIPIMGLFLIELRSLQGYKALKLPVASIVSYGLNVGDFVQVSNGLHHIGKFVRKVDENDVEVEYRTKEKEIIKKTQIINIVQEDELGKLTYIKYRD
ncbi:MAG: adenine phosphoribosyltransferase [Firmicutes bacterium]|uniref:Adenine phosphoribosyltransferase n=1 Tax=Candidatus Onthovivens merdipullorum TaxID=2840889 RepID=A0A9D9DIS3_9BACL|nr:adenine phosphoribosyltransferase [Candidatus Onthovivens merdipullorum]